GFRWRFWIASALACGLGLLSKGPVAVVLVVAPVLAFTLLARSTPRPRLAAWLAYGAVAVSVALPWYVAVMARDPGFANYFFWKHHVERFVSPFDHQEPIWFYAPEILLGMLPWTLLIPGTLRMFVGRHVWPGLSLRSPGTATTGASKSQPRRLAALIFFS